MALKEKFIVICSSPRNGRHSTPGRPQGGVRGPVRGQKRMRARQVIFCPGVSVGKVRQGK